jgi:hypothetical protein
MALANVIVPAFPDVPRAPGVPPVLRAIGGATTNIVMLAADAVAIIRLFRGPQWGLFANGVPLLIGDSVLAFDFRKEWRISDYPIEQGGFRSYDKIEVPFDVRITFAVSGSPSLLSSLIPGAAGWMAPANRTAALTALDAAAKSLDLITAVTPEAQYQNCNIVHYDYRREARGGTTLIRVDVWLVEIRIAPSPQFTETKTEAAADPASGGGVQATPLPPPPAPPVGPTAPPGGGTGLTIDPLPLAPPEPPNPSSGLVLPPLGTFT